MHPAAPSSRSRSGAARPFGRADCQAATLPGHEGRQPSYLTADRCLKNEIPVDGPKRATLFRTARAGQIPGWKCEISEERRAANLRARRMAGGLSSWDQRERHGYRATIPQPGGMSLSGRDEWQPVGESNPSSQVENLVS